MERPVGVPELAVVLGVPDDDAESALDTVLDWAEDRARVFGDADKWAWTSEHFNHARVTEAAVSARVPYPGDRRFVVTYTYTFHVRPASPGDGGSIDARTQARLCLADGDRTITAWPPPKLNLREGDLRRAVFVHRAGVVETRVENLQPLVLAEIMKIRGDRRPAGERRGPMIAAYEAARVGEIDTDPTYDGVGEGEAIWPDVPDQRTGARFSRRTRDWAAARRDAEERVDEDEDEGGGDGGDGAPTVLGKRKRGVDGGRTRR